MSKFISETEGKAGMSSADLGSAGRFWPLAPRGGETLKQKTGSDFQEKLSKRSGVQKILIY